MLKLGGGWVIAYDLVEFLRLLWWVRIVGGFGLVEMFLDCFSDYLSFCVFNMN